MIDWNVALSTSRRLMRPGPELSQAEVGEVVAELREASLVAEGPVREFTGLVPRYPTPVLVVDRPRWAEANLATFRLLMSPLDEKLAEAGKLPTGLPRAVGGRVAGVELGAIVAFLGGKVLGQFDPFAEGEHGPGRLLLVAPNIVHVERELDVDPSDFRRWVCLHEETHRAQFTAVPWMRDHMMSKVEQLMDATDVSGGAVTDVVSEALPELVRIVRGESDKSLSDLFQNEQQREVVDGLTGLMSLLEGHADVVMDDIGPEVVPSVAEIRRKFTKRRGSGSALQKVVRRLLGYEAKMRQYSDGASFVRRVMDQVGKDGFDAVWADPAHLPTRAEIIDPKSWVARVHG
ncbi:zinc-dependent metalloprotease [Aeromicrobium senzhongii]|uniref:Zinc-dependent metalloprotease n=1 Tax=Aeromicrobium senzhongii TaxID=2663859 RepID=A0ABX6SY12_9ACTN|nr:zinc-dependent metalloprotease [Aeromicrobium senzhongii]MTB88595.1 coenzyme F420 biosynthesis-associated protein [Aeromicrobium senzhongii]QNL94095.1 zinc-dependent metalloprotease [Aeromicrobium senzhongii]